jgi:cyclic pyranopterin phosphate synthase
MLKRYEKGMRIEAVELVEKAGGRSGHWRRGEIGRAARPERPGGGRSRNAKRRG